MTYGATKEEWAIWARLAPNDLLCTVMDPSVPQSPTSKVKAAAKIPTRIDRHDHYVGIHAWQDHVSSPRDLAKWSSDSRLGICVVGRQIKAIDIDIEDRELAAEVEGLIEMLVGPLPARRRSNSGKLLLAFRLGGELPKRKIDLGLEKGIIELLGHKQQFLVAGEHKSGARYEWGDGALDADIPELSLDELDALWAMLAKQYAVPGGVHEDREGGGALTLRRIADINDPLVPWMQEKGMVLHVTSDGKVFVRCPWKHEHSDDSGDSETVWLPAGVGGREQGHFRCQHSHCLHRTDGDFLEAIGYVKEDFDVIEPEVDKNGRVKEALPGFARTRDGQIKATLNNVLMALRRPDVCGVRLGYDEFRAEMMFAPGSDGGAWQPFTNTTQVDLRERLEYGTAGFQPIGRELIRDAAAKVAAEQAFDSARDWANSLEWDGVLRAETFYSDFFGVPDSSYTRAVARYTWSGLAARCLDPGHKCDMVPVFIGLQGAGKTSAVMALSPARETFVEINLERKDDDLARTLRGKLVGEIAELRGLQTRDAEGIKSWISREFEEWTPKWQEYAVRFSRRLLFFGTGNTKGFLDDDEERRWLPMVVGEVDVDGIRAVRDQLWAEGVHMFKRLGHVDWKGAYDLGRHEHAEFKASDPWEEIVAAWLDLDAMDGDSGTKRRDTVVRTLDVLSSALGIRADRADRKAELRIGKVLRRLGFTKGNFRVNGEQKKGWKRTEGDFGDLA